MESIRQAITRAAAENRMRVQTPTDSAAADHILAAVLEAMKAEGMVLFDKPVTTAILNRQIEETGKFEQALAETAQELNEALGNLDCAESKEGANKAIKALVESARQAVKQIEQTNPNWPLHKQSPQSAEDRLWEHHLLRGMVPSDEAIQAVRKATP
jgi:hypothetical protein